MRAQEEVCDCEDRWTCERCGYSACRECDGEFPKCIRLDDGVGEYCEACTTAIIEEYREEIAEYVAQVKLTGELEVYDPFHHYAPTMDEYESGCREAHTENAVRTRNRHSGTNYDELIRGLSKDDALDRAIYEAVRARVHELLDEAEGRPHATEAEPSMFGEE